MRRIAKAVASWALVAGFIFGTRVLRALMIADRRNREAAAFGRAARGVRSWE